ncbi:MAG: hypothetical protein HC841_02725 [Verrucomicrobiae bacterium]|nr:hypothetical protein [Verrucomicrobiae bacterium]
MILRSCTSVLAILTSFAFASVAAAEPTKVTVRAASKDAKFIGSSIGGMRVTLTDTQTGEILATGVTKGTTGDTKRLMNTPRQRGATLSDDKAAKFTATLNLDEPRLVKVTLFGPLTQKQSAVEVSATQWVVPGKHIDAGDAWTIEVPGMIVDVLSPPAHVKLKGAPQTINLQANVMMMCGCPIEPGGIWDAGKFEVVALMTLDGKPLARLPLTYAGKESQFGANFEAKEKGVYEATVYAYDAQNGNTGLDRASFVVE